ncbi:MAG: hypothetical protein AAF492_09490 [Verrucomicrobiota bacterium]
MMESDRHRIEEAVREALPGLDRLRDNLRRSLLLEGVILVVAAFLIWSVVSLRLDLWLHLSRTVRICVLLVSLAGFFWLCLRFVIRVIEARIGYEELAGLLDRASPHLSQQVSSVLQLPARLDDPENNSTALVEKAVLENARTLKDYDFDQHFDARRFNLARFGLGAAIGVAAWLCMTHLDTVSLWSKRWFLGSNEPWPQETYLEVGGVVDGAILVPRGEAHVLRVSARDDSRVPDFVRMRIRDADGERQRLTLTRFDENDFRHTFEAVHLEQEIRLRGNDDRYGPITIRPVDRPRIKQMKLVARHPSEPEARTFAFTGRDADLAFLPETELSLEVEANAPLHAAGIRASGDAPTQLDRIGERQFKTAWTHRDLNHIEIDMTGVEGGIAARPVAFTIGLLKDRPPFAGLRVSGVRLRVTPEATVPLNLQARDDYGLSRVSLETRTEGVGTNTVARTESRIGLYEKGGGEVRTDQRLSHRIQLDAYELKPGMMWQVHGVAEDYCYSGSQTGLSRELLFSIVTPEDLYREIILNLQGKRAVFRKATEQAEEIRRKLEVAPPGENASDWIRGMRVIQQRVSSVSQSFNDALEEMKLNRLGDPESHDLILRQVIEPLKVLKEERLPEQIIRLTRLNENTPVAQLEEATERQLQVVAEMKAILRNMSQWESFVDVLNQLDEVIQIEKRVLERTEKAAERVIESLFDD